MVCCKTTPISTWSCCLKMDYLIVLDLKLIYALVSNMESDVCIVSFAFAFAYRWKLFVHYSIANRRAWTAIFENQIISSCILICLLFQWMSLYECSHWGVSCRVCSIGRRSDTKQTIQAICQTQAYKLHYMLCSYVLTFKIVASVLFD